MESRIMIVDDNPVNRRMLSLMLDQEGFETVEAAGGSEAIELARKQAPDAILLDIMMPEVDGFGVCQALKEDPDFEDIPVLFISALDGTEAKVRALELGAEDYITKPFQRPEVLARVRRSLLSRRRVRRYQRKATDLENSERRLLSNVQSAVELQESMMPGPSAGGSQIAAQWLRWPNAMPSPEMLGVQRLDENTCGAWILDAGGHGMGAAVSAMMLAKLLSPKPGSLTHPKIQGGPGYYVAPPAEVVNSLDRVAGLAKIDPHLSFHYLTLDSSSGLLKYANTGQPDPLLVRPDGPAQWLHGVKPPAGTSSHGGVFQGEVRLRKGDRIVLFTDGVSRAVNAESRCFGEGRAEAQLAATRGRPLKEAVEGLMGAVSAYAGTAALAEARAVLGLEYLGPKRWTD